MEFKDICITMARIHLPEELLSYGTSYAEKTFKLNITFSDSFATLQLHYQYKWFLNNLGHDKHEANDYYKQIIKRFNEADIHDGALVGVLFEEGIVIAISSGNDLWIDVADNFSVKTFKELNINITSLNVY